MYFLLNTRLKRAFIYEDNMLVGHKQVKINLLHSGHEAFGWDQLINKIQKLDCPIKNRWNKKIIGHSKIVSTSKRQRNLIQSV